MKTATESGPKLLTRFKVSGISRLTFDSLFRESGKEPTR